VRNADYNYDPRDWRHRRGPAGRRRGHRPACQALPGNASRPGHSSRRTTHDCCRPFDSGARRTFRGGFVYHSAYSAVVPTVPGSAELFSILVDAAREHFTASRYAAADAFLKLIGLHNTHPAATWQQLGQLYFSLAEYEAAGRAYGYAAAYDPSDASLQVHLAHTCLLLGDVPSFEGYMRRALARDPESPPALQLLADLNRDEGLYADAANYYDRIIQGAPQNGCNRLLEGALEPGRYSLAPQIHACDAGDKLSPPLKAEAELAASNHYENLLSLALCHSYLGANEAALDCLQRAGEIARGTLVQPRC